MSQKTLLNAVSAEAASPAIYIGGSKSVTVQCKPESGGFTGTVAIEVAFVPQPDSDICFPIATFDIPPWFEVVLLTFSAHAIATAFTVFLDGSYTWIRARVVGPKAGAMTVHMAY